MAARTSFGEDGCNYFPKNTHEELLEFARTYDRYLWRIQEVARLNGMSRTNLLRADNQRCALLLMATTMMNAVFDKNRRAICPVRCVETNTEMRSVSIRVPCEEKEN